MKQLLIKAGIALSLLGLIGGVAYASVVNNDNQDKINICHKTDSTKNPFIAIQIDKSALQTHLDHGDFKYLGLTDDKGKPVKGGSDWCNDPDNQPKPETPPVVTNPPTNTTPTITALPQVGGTGRLNP